MAVDRAVLPYFSPDSPRVLAHRGLATDAVENTLQAFAAARDAGARYIETDAHATSDGVAVLIHDPEITTGATRHRVRDLTLAQVQALDLGRGAVVPALEEALSAFGDLRFNIDVKAEDAAGPVAEAIIAAGAADRVLVTSFDERRRRRTLSALSAVGIRAVASAASSSIVVRAIVVARLGGAGRARRMLGGVNAMQVPERQGRLRIVTPLFLRAMHRAGIEVHVWTVNDPDDMRRLLALGVDGIVTDRCDLAVPVVAEHRARTGI